MRAVMREQPNFRPSFFRRCFWVGLSASAMLALAACGGGGGGGDSSNPPPSQGTDPPPNTAPVADAGADQEITLPTDSVELAGSATDAEGPAASLTYAWSVTSGSGVTFSSASTAATTATFAAAGTYVLTLTVSDGSLDDTDEVQVIVNEAAAGGNEAPVVTAGEDQTIELPATDATLQGSATDDGAADALTYSWTVTSGAEGVTFDDAAAASTVAHFPAAGEYELTLTVGDGTDTGADALLVTVNPAVYPGPDDDSADGGWLRVAAADVGMDQTLLDQASTFALTGNTGVTIGGSGMIVRHGRLVHSWGNIDERFDVKSTTKSIGGIALGLAIDQGLVALADSAQTHLPEIGVDPADPTENVGSGWLDDITVLQLATHTAGFAKPGGYVKLLYEPGTTWSYSDAGLNWLADMLTTVYGTDLASVLAPVWSTLGVEAGVEGGGMTCGNPLLTGDVCWRANVERPGPHPSGIEHRELASGIDINANAMARIGLLFLRNGVWANDQRVISEAFVHTVQTPPEEVAGTVNSNAADYPDATSNYGVLWWTNATGSTGLLPNVPADAYWAWGLGDSLIIVIPSLDLVIVRAGVQTSTDSTGRIWNDNDWDGNYAVLAPFLEPIVSSVITP